MKNLSGPLAIFVLFLVGVAALVLWQIWDTVLWAGQILIIVGVIILTGLGLVLAVAVALRIWDWCRDMLFNTTHDRRMKDVEHSIAQREANTWETIAPPGSMVIRHTTDDFQVVSEPLHTIPGRVNGAPSAFSDDEVKRWLAYLAAYGKGGSGGLTELQTPLLQAPPLPPLLDVLYDAPRIALGGTSGAGKTTVAKMLMAEDMRRGKKIMFISPHETGTLGDVPVVGVGRNYEDIAITLETLVLMMTSRYQDVALGKYAHFGHKLVSVYIDEWTSIKRQVDNAGEILGTLITEARKINIQLTVLTHSLKVETLGINTDLRQSLTLAWLDGGEGQSFESAIYKYGPTGKLTIIPHSHPGYRDVILPTNQFIDDIPTPQTIKAITLHDQGFSDTAIAKEIFNVKRPNGTHLTEVRQLYADSSPENA